jgi:hypothetical protein
MSSVIKEEKEEPKSYGRVKLDVIGKVTFEK